MLGNHLYQNSIKIKRLVSFRAKPNGENEIIFERRQLSFFKLCIKCGIEKFKQRSFVSRILDFFYLIPQHYLYESLATAITRKRGLVVKV